MAKVNANWVRLKMAWTAIIALSLRAMWLVKRDWVTGLALGLVLICAVALVIDTFAERRANLHRAARQALTRVALESVAARAYNTMMRYATALGLTFTFAFVACSATQAPEDPQDPATTSSGTGGAGGVAQDGGSDAIGGTGGGTECELGTLEHCGACNQPCAPANVNEASCEGDTCGYDTCSGSFLDCDADASNGCETDGEATATCGACDIDCGVQAGHVANATCEEGTCNYDTCESLWADCDENASNGCEKPINTLPDCGECGKLCNPDNVQNALCDAGECYYDECVGLNDECDGDLSNGCETDVSSDPLHCGACNEPCPQGVSCKAGSCEYSWEETFFNNQNSPDQCTTFQTFVNGLTDNYSIVTISGTFNAMGVSCTDPAKVQMIADALRTQTSMTINCDGNDWSICDRNNHRELWLNPPTQCSGNNCPTGYIIRPCIGNVNWGGVNTATCNAPNQDQKVAFF